MRVAINEHDALIVVDVQNDFCPGGALAVADGDKVVPVLNELIARFHLAGLPVVATRDWHPGDHVSFTARGGPWPLHCVKDTEGAAFHPALELPPKAHIVSKGDDPDKDAYSGFDGTGLGQWMRSRGVHRVIVGGLATDYCVKATALHAAERAFQTFVLTDASRGVDVNDGDSERAMQEMMLAGAVLIESGELVR